MLVAGTEPDAQWTTGAAAREKLLAAAVDKENARHPENHQPLGERNIKMAQTDAIDSLCTTPKLERKSQNGSA